MHLPGICHNVRNGKSTTFTGQNANLSCLHKSSFWDGIRIYNGLRHRFTSPQNDKAQYNIYIKKSKGVPWQAEVAQGVPGRLRPRIFLTFRHYKGGSSSAERTGRLYPRRNPWYSLSEDESTSGHIVLSRVPRKKSPVTPLGIDIRTVRLVAQCLNHYATPGPTYSIPYNYFGKLTDQWYEWMNEWMNERTNGVCVCVCVFVCIHARMSVCMYVCKEVRPKRP